MTKDFTIDTIDVHPGYGADCKNCPLYNDLALLKLTDHIQFDKNIRHICLPTKEETLEQTELIVTGWGKTETADRSNVLLKVSLKFVDNKKCETIFQEQAGLDIQIRETQFCAQGDLGSDSCTGDSGGPLINLNGIFKNQIVGIVSTGASSCISRFPAFYTNVFEYVKYIQDYIYRNRKNK